MTLVLLPLVRNAATTIDLPSGAEVVGVVPPQLPNALGSATARLVLLADPARPSVARRFWCYGQGDPVPDGIGVVGVVVQPATLGLGEQVWAVAEPPAEAPTPGGAG